MIEDQSTQILTNRSRLTLLLCQVFIAVRRNRSFRRLFNFPIGVFKFHTLGLIVTVNFEHQRVVLVFSYGIGKAEK